jgi:hypothetical protein
VGSELGGSTQELLHWLRFMVYRHASEILHGTHFGACYLLGLTDPRQHEDAQSLADHLGHHNMMVLMVAFASLLSLVEAFHSQSRPQEFEQQYKWISLPKSGILMPGTRGAYHEQTTQAEPFTGI